MHERDYTLTLGSMLGYFNDRKLNPHEELLKDFQLLLKVHRDHINDMNWSEYQEYKKQRL